MDPFSMMMAASRATNKKVEVVAIKPVVVKRKVGRPSATKIPEPIIAPFAVNKLMASTGTCTHNSELFLNSSL